MRAPIIDPGLVWPVAYLRTNPPSPPTSTSTSAPGRKKEERDKSENWLPSPATARTFARFPPWIELVPSLKLNQWMLGMGWEGSKVDKNKYIPSYVSLMVWTNEDNIVSFPDYSVFTLPFYILGVNIWMIIFQKFLHTLRISEEQRELIFNQFIICWQSLCIPKKKCKNVLQILHIYDLSLCFIFIYLD